MSDLLNRLIHIRDALAKIDKHTQRGRQKFDTEEEIQDSIIRNLQIVGEAASAIPLEFRKQHKEIPWRLMIDTRNRLIHDYAGINLNRVWDTATDSVPALAPKIHALIENIIAEGEGA